MKHAAAKTPRTAPMVPADGGPGRLYTYLNATLREPYAAATKMSSARPYHTLFGASPVLTTSLDVVVVTVAAGEESGTSASA